MSTLECQINIPHLLFFDLFPTKSPHPSLQNAYCLSRTIVKSKMEIFVTKVNSWIPLTSVTKISILDFVVVLETPVIFGRTLVTEVEKEAPNRMKIRFHRLFPRIWTYLVTDFFSTAMWTPLGGCFCNIFGTIFNNCKQVNVSGTNSMTYFICSVTLLHFLVFVIKLITTA